MMIVSFPCHPSSSFGVIPVLDTGIQTLIVILVNKSGTFISKCSIFVEIAQLDPSVSYLDDTICCV
ncbi:MULTISPECIES: hypothetical protein [unclassified Wolbachia]|uniref:hypothetical protein n=1 Tax=unclassified Wolbachia TaxID=2640676 RepID=UPI00223233B3|nr:hypothetical protein [Wolbachia endosymbiont (group A) of Apoderus coryli]